MGWTEAQFKDLCEKTGVKPEDALKAGKLDLSPEHKASNSLAQSKNSKKRHANERRAKKGYVTKIRAGSGVCGKKPKRNSPYALVASQGGIASRDEKPDSRIRIQVTSFRRRYLDPDNHTASLKFLLDALQLCGAIPSDAWDTIKLEPSQSKVISKKQEKTRIIIEYPDECGA